jgi:hypothetical protein
MSEKQIMIDILFRLTEVGVRLWRNNSGYLQAKNGQYVHFGLGTGSSDLIGLMPGSGRFLAIECKTEKGKDTPEQEAFLVMVNKMGGLGFIARSSQEALEKIRGAL